MSCWTVKNLDSVKVCLEEIIIEDDRKCCPVKILLFVQFIFELNGKLLYLKLVLVS